MTPSPADLLRLPGETVGGARRVIGEIVLMRRLLETATSRVRTQHEELMAEVTHMRAEIARIRRRVDELADTVPTQDDDAGPLQKAKDLLS